MYIYVCMCVCFCTVLESTFQIKELYDEINIEIKKENFISLSLRVCGNPLHILIFDMINVLPTNPTWRNLFILWSCRVSTP
jgi:hypothetical protein